MEGERAENWKTIFLKGRMNSNQNFTAQGSPIKINTFLGNATGRLVPI